MKISFSNEEAKKETVSPEENAMNNESAPVILERDACDLLIRFVKQGMDLSGFAPEEITVMSKLLTKISERPYSLDELKTCLSAAPEMERTIAEGELIDSIIFIKENLPESVTETVEAELGSEQDVKAILDGLVDQTISLSDLTENQLSRVSEFLSAKGVNLPLHSLAHVYDALPERKKTKLKETLKKIIGQLEGTAETKSEAEEGSEKGEEKETEKAEKAEEEEKGPKKTRKINIDLNEFLKKLEAARPMIKTMLPLLMAKLPDMLEKLEAEENGPQECWTQLKKTPLMLATGIDQELLIKVIKLFQEPICNDIASLRAFPMKVSNDIAENEAYREERVRKITRTAADEAIRFKALVENGMDKELAISYMIAKEVAIRNAAMKELRTSLSEIQKGKTN